jgi:hypothetical protein
MNYYPEQLQYIANACFALNKLEEGSPKNQEVYIGEVTILDSDNNVIGHLKDEIGGSYSFFPAEK